MANVNAFVGHSFLAEDETVVRKFTDFFDQISKSQDFEWVNATDPRADDVTSKVLDLFEGRNVFIGICTPSESVAKDKSFANTAFGNCLKIKKDDLQFKTSDWVIQEIGLAIGRKMKIIILLQDGVRKPGSLQGNIEYIPFNRNAVEKSFGSILGMITNIQDSDGKSTRPLALPKEGTASDEANELKPAHGAEEPNESWNGQTFELEFFLAVATKNLQLETTVSDAWLKRIDPNPEARAIWETTCLRIQTQYTENNYLEKILSIAQSFPKSSMIQRNLAKVHEHFEDYRKARDCYNISFDISVDDNEKQLALADIAKMSQRLGDEPGLEAAVSKLSSLVNTQKDEIFLLTELEDLAPWGSANKILSLALMERTLELDPTDVRKPFQLAYAYSESDHEALTMYHYEKIPHAKRDPLTWNNLGVVYRHFSLPGLSVSALSRAADQGETLAMSNLAERFMSAGFLREARDELLRATSNADAHKNVAKSQVRLSSIETDETEKKMKSLEPAPSLSHFLSMVGHSIWQAAPSNLGKRWRDKNVSLLVKIEDGQVLAEGSYEKAQPENALSIRALGTRENSIGTYHVTISGRLIGSVLVGKYAVSRVGKNFNNNGLIGLVPKDLDIVAVFEPENRSLRCLVEKELREFEILY